MDSEILALGTLLGDGSGDGIGVGGWYLTCLLCTYAAGLERPHPLGIGIPSREKSRRASHVRYAVAREL